MNVIPPLPVSQRRRADLVCLAAGVVVLGLGIPLSVQLAGFSRPALPVLGCITMIAALAGAAAVRLSGRPASDTGWQAARLGARAGLFSSAVSAGMLVLATRLADASGLFAVWVSAPLCILPGALAGMAGASLGMAVSAPAPADSSREPSPVPAPDGISWYAFLIWGLALIGLLSPLWLRSWRGYFPLPVIKIEAPPPPPVELPKPSAPLPSPPPRFDFTPSAELSTTPALRWEITDRKTVPDISGDGLLALSGDGRWLAGMADGDVALIDLHTLDTKCRWRPLAKIQSLAFSPDGQQLFLVTEESPAHVAVLRVEGTRVIPLPQPKKRLVPAGPPRWHEPMAVLFLSSGDVPLVLNLATLEIDPLTTTSDWKAKSEGERAKWTVQGQSAWPENEHWRLSPLQFTTVTELPEVEGTNNGFPENHRITLGVSDKTSPAAQAFPAIDLEKGDRFLASPDGSKFLRCRGGSVEVFYFRPAVRDSPAAWTVTMPHAPDKLEDLTAKSAMEEKSLCAFAYRPLVNPLNNQVIGPDRTRLLALVRLTKWEGTQGGFANALQVMEPSGPVVIADPHRWTGTRPELVEFVTLHRWWAPALSDKATSLSPLPALLNQPRIETRLDAGAMRITDIREPEPPSPPTPPQPLTPLPQSPSTLHILGVPLVPHTPEPDRVIEFLKAHHAKAQKGNIKALVSDYADRVQFLTNGKVSRADIEKIESKDQEDKFAVEEKIEGQITIQPIEEHRYEARYLLHSATTGREDHTVTEKRTPLLMEIVVVNGQPRIVRQVAEKPAR